VHSLAAIASSLALAKVSIYNEDQPQEVDALYAAKLRIAWTPRATRKSTSWWRTARTCAG
jgi:hypothetical protein